MSATVQVERSLDKATAAHSQAQVWTVAGAAVIVVALLVWWAASNHPLIVNTVFPYQVTAVDAGDGSMSLVHGRRRYLVRCGEKCVDFKTGGLYRMNDVGAFLQYSRDGQNLSLPIIEEETTFDVTGGHG